MSEISIKQAQQQVDDWINQVGIRYFGELTQFAVLAEEFGEVARIIARQYGEQVSKKTDEPGELGAELADMLFTMICLANSCNIDLSKEFEKTMAKKHGRDATRYKDDKKFAAHG